MSAPLVWYENGKPVLASTQQTSLSANTEPLPELHPERSRRIVEGSDPTPKVVSVIIPFSKPDTIGNTLRSIVAQDYPSEQMEIIVVGKGSTALAADWPQIIALDVGPIFRPGRARNLGASKARGKNLLFLDDDCEAQPDWIKENLAELEQPKVGAVSGKIIGKSRAYFARCVDFTNFSLCQVSQRQVRPLCSASFGIRREVLNQVGGFNESLKVHEDIDLCHRLERAGYQTVYQPKIVVQHDHRRTTLKSLITYLYTNGREVGLETEVRYRDLSKFYRFITAFRHPLVYLFMILPFALLATLQTVRINFREHPDVLWLSPFIFVGKFSGHCGIWHALWQAGPTHSLLREAGRLLEYMLFKQRIKTPRVITLFVTSHCNAKCQHCFYWENLNQNRDLTFDELEALSRSLGKVDVLLISGGEPFLRRDLPEVCELFFERNDLGALNIPTNGLQPKTTYTLTRRILEIARGRPVHIALSIDGTEPVHDEIRAVPGNFRRAVETFQALRPLQAEFPNLRLRVNSTVVNRNYQDLFKLFETHPTHFPGVNTPSLSLLRGSPYDHSLLLPSEPELRTLYAHRNQHCEGERSWLSKKLDQMIFELSLETLRQNTQVVPCEAGRIQGVIEDNGNVRQCELLPPIGNLRQASFEEIWNSPKAHSERQKIVEKRCHCTHECFLYPSLLAHPTAAIKVMGKS
jgi:MoaA/NifB/PqqE/SkfB family radical SAM enzyme/GT2 family glycosyltransferase